MLFGQAKRRLPIGTPPFNPDAPFPGAGIPADGMSGRQPMAMMQAPQKHGFGHTLGKIAGVIGDSLLMANGGAPIYTQGIEADRQARAEQQLAQLSRSQGLEDYEAKQKIEAKYRPGHIWESNDGSLMQIGPDGMPQIVYKDPTPKINWIAADDGQGGKQLVPVGPNGPLGGAGFQTGRKPVGKLTPIGGPTLGASGNFPR